MKQKTISIEVGDDCSLEAFLTERIYEYNAEATGYFDGQPFHAVHRNEHEDIQAGIYGYTWGGCCYLAYLWVHATLRGHGLGRELLMAAEMHARSRGCALVIVSSHSFQAPEFYEKCGYERTCEIQDHPVGHTNAVLIKRLTP